MNQLVDVSRPAQPQPHQEPRSLNDLNLEHELLSQYNVAKSLLDEVIGDYETPANQKAQVINSLLSITSQIMKMQTELHTAERIKAIEAACIKAIKTLDPAAQEVFFKRYESFYAENTASREP